MNYKKNVHLIDINNYKIIIYNLYPDLELLHLLFHFY